MDRNFGNTFFLQILSIEKWSNMSVFFQPTGFINDPLKFYIRIYTTLHSVGHIQFDNVSIDSLQYYSIAEPITITMQLNSSKEKNIKILIADNFL